MCLIGLDMIGLDIIWWMCDKVWIHHFKLPQLVDSELCEQVPPIPKPYNLKLNYLHQSISQTYMNFRNTVQSNIWKVFALLLQLDVASNNNIKNLFQTLMPSLQLLNLKIELGIHEDNCIF